MRAYILIGFQEERAGPVTAPFAVGLLFSLSLFPGALLKKSSNIIHIHNIFSE